jgi:2'-5' RNA ligase
MVHKLTSLPVFLTNFANTIRFPFFGGDNKMKRKAGKAMAQFFAGVVPPGEIAGEVEQWRRKFKAPGTPAHLTLLAPFAWDQDQKTLLDALGKVCAGHRKFDIGCRGLGSFGTAVIFIDIVPGPELLALQKDLARCLEELGIEPEKRPYHPHITLATRLNRSEFDLYKQTLIGYNPQYSFACGEITLFKLYIDGRIQRWQVSAVVPLEE